MRRTGVFARTLLVVITLAALVSGARAQSQADLQRKLDALKAYPDMILVNGRVHTMDSKLSEYQAFAIRNTRIIALGTNDEIRFLAGPNTKVVDAKGRVVLPALIDGHTHPTLWGVQHWLGAKAEFTAKTYNMPELRAVQVKGNDGATLMRGIEKAVIERAKELGPDKWIIVWLHAGTNTTLEESNNIIAQLLPRARTGGAGIQAPLTQQFLDTIAPNNPTIIFTGGGTGNNVKNLRARQEWVKVIGEEQTQGLMEAPQLLWEILLRSRPDVQDDLLKRELLECIAAQGIGTFGDRYDRAVGAARIYRRLYEKGEMPVRWGYTPSIGKNSIDKYLKLMSRENWQKVNVDAGKGYSEDTITDFFSRIFIKEQPDFRGIGNDYIWYAGTANEGWEEGITCTTAKQPPADKPKPQYGWELRTDCTKRPDLEKQGGYITAKAALQHGLRVGFMHGYSDGTYDAIFKMIEDSMAEGKITLDQVRALRLGTEHNPIIRPDQVEKFAKYNFMPGFNGYQVQGDIKGGAFLKTYGEQYMNWMAPVGSLVKAGAHIAFNTDAHLTDLGNEWKSMEHPEQWRGSIWAFMEFFATRTMPDNGIIYNKAEAIDKTTLMKAATIWAAEQLLNEKNIGSLETGKLGDYIIIDKDYFALPVDQIHTIKPLLTVVGGKVVFQSPNL
jgi:predicted amidohydrolase YtcJ